MKTSLKPYTTTYYDFMEMFHEVEKTFNIDLRNVAGKTYGKAFESDIRPYQDFWHWCIDAFPGMGNDSMISNDWQEMAENCKDEPDWVKMCLNFFAELYGDLGYIEMKVSW